MERVMSVEEKIRRAEEIYERKRQGNIRPVATVNINEKKDIKLLKKMLIQILICVSIYLIIQTIQKNEYVFSDDFIKKVDEIISYDANFGEIYLNAKNKIISMTKNGETQKESPDENTEEKDSEDKENVENTEIVDGKINQSTAIGGATEENTGEKVEIKPLSQEEQDIINIKNTTTFIKPTSGNISSPYGYRENATGRVPKNHTGVDIAALSGTKIISATDGKVEIASNEGDYRKTFENSNRRS